MLEITVLNPNEHFQSTVDWPRFRIGSCADSDKNLVVINDPLVSDFQCLVEVSEGIDGAQLQITNLGKSMVLGRNSRLHHLVSSLHAIPCSLGVGDSYIQITHAQPQCTFDHAIQHMPMIGSAASPELVGQKLVEVSPSPETLASWFESLGEIQRCTAGHETFFKLAARCVFNPGGMDGCLILRKNIEWEIVAQHIPFPTDGIFYRRDLVDQANDSKTPLFHDNGLLTDFESTKDLHAAVVCPVLDDNQDVQAVVYGFRNQAPGNNRRGIRRLEAKFVSLVTDSLSAGMIRLNQEANRARQRVLLEQAFSPKVVRQLESNPNFMAGQERDVSVLFADLRGFCRISESIGATITYQLLTDVMNRFTRIVHDHDGVVIDFYGDGMSAFWNAPVDQPNHAQLACQAGTAILDVMPELNEVWSVEIGKRLRAGIGINTGVAQVGNSGSQNRLKYGPQGSVVNFASRLENATKQLGVDLVVSESTAQRVQDQFVARRICNARLNGFGDPVGVYTLVDPIAYAQLSQYYESYERGLALFEDNKYLEALDVLTDAADSHEMENLPMMEFILGQINSRLNPGHAEQKLASDRPFVTLDKLASF